MASLLLYQQTVWPVRSGVFPSEDGEGTGKTGSPCAVTGELPFQDRYPDDLLCGNLIIIDRVGIRGILRNAFHIVADDIGMHLIIEVEIICLVGKNLLCLDIVRLGRCTVGDGELHRLVDEGVELVVMQI